VKAACHRKSAEITPLKKEASSMSFMQSLARINARYTSTRLVGFSARELRRRSILDETYGIALGGGDRPFACDAGRNPIRVRELSNKLQFYKKRRIERNVNDEWQVGTDARDRVAIYVRDQARLFHMQAMERAKPQKSQPNPRVRDAKAKPAALGKDNSLRRAEGLPGLGENQHPRWDNFKIRILESCQREINSRADIIFTY
jgi:hypothetical protein